VSKNLTTQAAMWAMSVVEVFDFPPLFGYLDAHALWHLCGIPITFMWNKFLIADAQHHLRRKID
jgi:hypothetical protein